MNIYFLSYVDSYYARFWYWKLTKRFCEQLTKNLTTRQHYSIIIVRKYCLAMLHCSWIKLISKTRIFLVLDYNKTLTVAIGQYSASHCLSSRLVIRTVSAFTSKCSDFLKACYLVVGVDDPKTSEVETSVQLPTSSSSSEKQAMSSTEDKPGNYTTTQQVCYG